MSLRILMPSRPCRYPNCAIVVSTRSRLASASYTLARHVESQPCNGVESRAASLRRGRTPSDVCNNSHLRVALGEHDRHLTQHLLEHAAPLDVVELECAAVQLRDRVA